MKKSLCFLLAAFLTTFVACDGPVSQATAIQNEPKSDETEKSIVRRSPLRSEVLKRKILVRFRRAYLSEVVIDLKSRVGLEFAFPKSIDKSFTFDLVEKEITVDEVLKQLAQAGNLTIDHRDDVTVFWQKANDEKIASLEKQIKDKTSIDRCRALEELGRMGDPRIYPILFWALAEGSGPMALASAHLLYDLHLDTLRFGKDRDQLGAGLARLLPTRVTVGDKNMCIELAGASRHPFCGELLLPLLKERQFGAYALSIIGETRDPRVIEPLLERLKTAPKPDPNDDTGYSPVTDFGIKRAIGQIGGMKAIHVLRGMLEKENDKYERMMLARFLIFAGDDRGFQVLLDLLKDSDPKKKAGDEGDAKGDAGGGGGGAGGGSPGPPIPFRAQLAYEFGVTRDPRAIEPLISLLKDADAQVRREAAQQLVPYRTPFAVDAYIAMLKSKEDRLLAIQSLQNQGDPRAAETVASYLDDANPWVRYTAGLYLLSQDDLRGSEAIHNSYKELPEAYHPFAIRALAIASDPKATKILTDAVDPTNDKDRSPRDAADTLGVLRDVKTIDALVGGLKNKNADSSFAAAMAISNMRDSRATQAAIELLKNDDVAMRVWGARILEWAPSEDATDALLAASTDESPEVRQYIGRALAAIGSRKSLEGARQMLKDPDRNVRRYTAAVLGKVADGPTVAALFDAMSDKDGFVRQAVGLAIIDSHHSGAIRQLVEMAKSAKEYETREAARKALLSVGYNQQTWQDRTDACVVDMLVVLSGDKDIAIRTTAVEILGSVMEPSTIQALKIARRDSNTAVRNVAQKAIQNFLAHPDYKKLVTGKE